MADKFEIYRPKVTLKRLDRENQPDIWSPTIHYKHSLQGIGEQLTPAEIYRKKLLDLGPESRNLRRLQWRWEKNFEAFTWASLKVQSLFRGHKHRKYFRKIKAELELLKRQRDTKIKVVELFSLGKKEEALDAIDELWEKSPDLLVIKMKIFYTLGNHDECEKTAAELFSRDEGNIDGRYILASSFCQRLMYEEAYNELCQLFSMNEGPQAEHIARLNALVCTKLKPPRFLEALESFDYLVENWPEDMNSLLQRACCLMAIQEWERAAKDLTLILDYQPDLTNVRNLRAHVNCCRRRWEWAKDDYTRVLEQIPDDPTAASALALINTPYEDLPMLDEKFLSVDQGVAYNG